MKILRVAADLYPYVIGGLALHAHEMSKAQKKLGHIVDVYTASTDIMSGDLFAKNYSEYKYNAPIKLLGNSIMPSMFRDLWKYRYDYDIIHAHSHLFFSTNLCALLRKMGSSPLVITNHGLNSQTAPKWFQNIYNYTGTKFTYLAADKIICYTEEEKKELMKFGIKAAKISVIHNGINTDLFVPPDKRYYDKKQILWVGRYVKGKGVDYLIDAFFILKSKFQDAHLTMVGKGPEKDRIVKKINELGLRESITLKDFIPNSEIVELYQNSSLFILPSLEEGVPRTILEAMACETPIVCTKLPQLVDIIGGGGILVPLRDTDALVNAVSEIIIDTKLSKKLGEYGRKNVVEKYSWSNTVEQTTKLFQELI